MIRFRLSMLSGRHRRVVELRPTAVRFPVCDGRSKVRAFSRPGRMAKWNEGRRIGEPPDSGGGPAPKSAFRSGARGSYMDEPLTIRDARADEAEYLSALAMRSKAVWGYPPAFMEACRRELEVTPEKIDSGTHYYFVAEGGGETLGFHAIERLAGNDFELEAMFVEPRHIGTGVGRSLIEHAKALASTLGARRLVIEGDPNAADFYRAAGGEQIGTRESGSLPGRFLPLFAISLAGDCPAQ